MTIHYDTLINTHDDGTASLTLYRSGTDDAVFEARLLRGHRWHVVRGVKRFDSLEEARTFVDNIVPRVVTRWEEPAHALWAF